MKEDIRKEIELKDGITTELVGGMLKIKGPKGEVQRDFVHPKISLKIEGNKIVLESKKSTKREKTIIGSFQAHIRNMVEGVDEPHTYKLKICSGHFPMNVTVQGQELSVKNFLGEAVPRKVTLVPGAKVKINGDEIVVTSADKEAAGQAAAQIESLCRITNRDKRIFQDGCYIVHKAGKDIV
jgi:large subunit ribosomal protein L6